MKSIVIFAACAGALTLCALPPAKAQFAPPFILDNLPNCAVQGSLLYRDTTAINWKCVGPGTAGNVLTTNGAGANPSWASAGSAGAGGTSGQVQWNNGGGLAGIAGSTWNGTTLTVPSLATSTFSTSGLATLASGSVTGTLGVTGTSNLGNVNTNAIVASSTIGATGAITGNTTVTGKTGLVSGVSGTTNGLLTLLGSTSGTVGVQTQAIAGTWNLTLPVNAGTNGYILSTDGSGNTTWIPQPAGGVCNSPCNIGAGTGSSLALAGATLGGNVFALTGASAFGGNMVSTGQITANGFYNPQGGNKNNYAMNSLGANFGAIGNIGATNWCLGHSTTSTSLVIANCNILWDDTNAIQLNAANAITAFGGTTSSFPALKQNGAALNVILANGLGDAALTAATATLGTNTTQVATTQYTQTELSNALGYTGWGPYSPTLGCTSGSVTGSATGRFTLIGKTVHWNANATITALSTCINLYITLPFLTKTDALVASGRDTALTGKMVSISASAGGPNGSIVLYDNTAVSVGAGITINGTYEAQ